jgi:phosphate starvation-inducible PhoH-like protein
VEGIAFVNFDDKDVVRHVLVQRIVKAYDRYNEQIGAGRQLAFKLGGGNGQGRTPEESASLNDGELSPGITVEIPDDPSLPAN